jgi:hypothetical protein
MILIELCAGVYTGAGDKIIKNYFIFQRTFGNGKIKLKWFEVTYKV